MVVMGSSCLQAKPHGSINSTQLVDVLDSLGKMRSQSSNSYGATKIIIQIVMRPESAMVLHPQGGAEPWQVC